MRHGRASIRNTARSAARAGAACLRRGCAGGEIILRRKWERVVFLVGLVAAILLGLAIYVLVWR